MEKKKAHGSYQIVVLFLGTWLWDHWGKGRRAEEKSIYYPIPILPAVKLPAQFCFPRASNSSLLKALHLYSSKDTVGLGTGCRTWLSSLLVPEQISLNYSSHLFPGTVARQADPRENRMGAFRGGQVPHSRSQCSSFVTTTLETTFTFSNVNL